MKFAVQLYSVRDHIENGNDLLEILTKVKEICFIQLHSSDVVRHPLVQKIIEAYGESQ